MMSHGCLIRGQHLRILQLYESALDDGYINQWESITGNPELPQITAAGKESSPHTTIFTTSTSPGEYPGEKALAGPIQINFSSDAKETDNFRVNRGWVTGPCHDNSLPSVVGNWPGNEVAIPSQVVVTPKGGTQSRTWDLFLEHIVKHMYPDLKDIVGKRVCVKTDLGPGRLNATIVRKWHQRGLYFKFGLPNGSGINQEHDQLFGFAACFCLHIVHALSSANC
jgi:hypothetical protein